MTEHFRLHQTERRRKTDLVKAAIKEALKEWMDEKYALIGKWTVRCFCTGAFCLFVKMLFYFNILDFRQFFDTSLNYVVDQAKDATTVYIPPTSIHLGGP